MNNITYKQNQDFIFKVVLLLLLLCLGSSLKAQMPSNGVKMAFKTDNADLLESEIDTSNIDFCYTMKTKDYNLLSIAIKYGATNCLKKLVDLGADIDKVCADKTPLMYAAKGGKLEMLKYLVENGADLTLENKGQTALTYSKKYENADCETYLSDLYK